MPTATAYDDLFVSLVGAFLQASLVPKLVEHWVSVQGLQGKGDCAFGVYLGGVEMARGAGILWHST
jgi:hypothetical protein